MEKIQYIAPHTEVVNLCHAVNILGLSGGETLQVGGDTNSKGITESDVKRNDYNVWNDDWSN